jgi:hypothetical protein
MYVVLDMMENSPTNKMPELEASRPNWVKANINNFFLHLMKVEDNKYDGIVIGR